MTLRVGANEAGYALAPFHVNRARPCPSRLTRKVEDGIFQACADRGAFSRKRPKAAKKT